MKIAAGIEKARMTVLLDVRHPFAYLALQPALALAESLALDVDWLPLTVPTLKPPSLAQPGDDRGARHRRYRGQAIAREIETYARTQGLVLREFYRSADADAANAGWLWVRARHPDRLAAYLVELFRSYWSLEVDPSSGEEVAGLVERVDADGASYLEWAGREGPSEVSALAAELQDRGLFQVPAYLVEDEVFYGRQHLPMIRWILAGRSGPIPI
ncbi:MAG: DsbA family protein [Myxococcota bacterium]|nr:DsbA family protein [Myxococcota bacterium]